MNWLETTAQISQIAAVISVIFVICDVHYLAYQKYLDDSIWQVWRSDLTRTIRCPLIAREWPDLKPKFESFKVFIHLVEENQEELVKGI